MPDTPRRHPNVVNLSEVEPRAESTGRFAFTTRHFTRAAGAQRLGCSWFEVAPGRTAFPTHYHCANEEAVYVLEGEGTLHLGDRMILIRAGDYATFPVGPEGAHQIVNTGHAPLRYLAMSTLVPVDAVGYPDSKKVGVMATSRFGERPWLRAIFKEDSQVEYYSGEKLDT